MSTALLLSIVTSGIVLVATVASAVVTAAALERSALERAQERLTRGVHQLATVAATGIRTARPRYTAVTRDSSVRRTLARGRVDGSDSARLRVVLARLSQPTDSGLPVELLDTAGRRLAFVGVVTPDSLALTLPGETRSSAGLRPGLPLIRPIDSVQVGQLYVDSNRTHFWIGLPVLERGRAIGYLVQQRRIASNRQAEETIRELAGDSTTGYYYNVDGSSWTSIGGRPAAAPRFGPDSNTRSRQAGGDVVFADAPVVGTPLVMSMEAPRNAVVARPHAIARQLAMFGLALTLVAGALAWIIGRQLARPVQRIAVAADDLARGHYDARVPVTGTHEISRLADRFNRMASELGQSRSAIQQREDELRQTARVADAANRAKTDFLAAMSHELRTPLNAIGGYAELLEMGLRGPLTDEQRTDLERIRAAQRHLLGLIGGVLDLNRIERGTVTYRLENVNLPRLIAELDALVRPQAVARGQSLTVRPGAPLTATADAEKLRQILINLLSNAIRHTPSGTSITIEFYPASDDTAEILVCDSGPGIPESRRGEIFEPFVQLDRTLTSSTEGVGLGLTISRDLARGMGGDLLLRDGTEAGTCFVVRLPLVRVAASTETT